MTDYPTFETGPDGNLFIAYGDRPMARWDGLLSDFVDAGVPAPDEKPALASSEPGTIVGDLFAYVRFLDDRGLVSNMSPLSDVHTVSSSEGLVEDASNEAPIAITSTGHGLTTGDIVKITGVLGNYAANGTWTVTVSDVDTFSLDESEGIGDYANGGDWYAGAGEINYSNIEVPTDPRVVKRQILRTKDGDASVFYIDLEDETLVGTTFDSTNSDDDLTDAVPAVNSDGEDFSVIRHGEPPAWKSSVANYQGRMWLAVDGRTSSGNVAVTNGSPTVTGVGLTEFTSSMVDWELFVDGANKSYTVSSVNVANQTLTLDENYAGTTDAYTAYTLRPSSQEGLTIYHSEPLLPESWNPLSGFTANADDGSGELVSLMQHERWLYLLFERAIHQATLGENGVAQDKVEDRGCVNDRCWTRSESVLYLMDRQGCYMYSGNGREDISQPIQTLFRDGAINWSARETFHSCYFPGQSTVKWFVCLYGYRTPHHALCYDTTQRRWWIEQYPLPILSSTLGVLKGKSTVFLGTTYRRFLIAETGNYDGANAHGTVTDSDLLSLTDSAASFDSNVVGHVVRIVSGKGAGQERIIVAQTSTKLTVKQPWLNKPDATSVYQVGGISWSYRTGWFRYVPAPTETREGWELVIQPTQSESRMSVRRRYNQSESPENYARTHSFDNGLRHEDGSPDAIVDTTWPQGYTTDVYDNYTGNWVAGRRFVQNEILGVTNNEQQVIRQLTIHGVSQ